MKRSFIGDRYQINLPLSSFPRWLSDQSVTVFFIAISLCTILFGYPMELRFAVVSILSVLIFFWGGRTIYKNAIFHSESRFLKNIVFFAIFIRIIWVAYCYIWFNTDYWGQAYGDDADTGWYMDFAMGIVNWVREGFSRPFSEVRTNFDSAMDDTGYPFVLAIEYLLMGVKEEVYFGPMIIKCLLLGICPLFMHDIAYRHFGQMAARLTAIFMAFNPNLIYWCGNMFKEAEMTFLVCWFLYRMDKILATNTFNMRSLLPATLIGCAIFFFRSSLALVLFISVFGHIVFASQRIISTSKKILAGLMVGVVLLIGMADNLRTTFEDVNTFVNEDKQQTNMEWRANREGGNSYAKYATAAVFAPLIFTIPFPTFNMANESQALQMQLSGGSFIKNILSAFVILVMFYFLLSGEWRRHVFIISYTCGYLAALVLSNFAQSGRFHMPVFPMLMLFAAFGICFVLQNKRWRKWWTLVLVIEVGACLVWNWLKLKGRGMI